MPSLFKAGPGSHVQYLLLDNRVQGQVSGQALPIDPVLGDRVLGMPGKLGIAHQDHVSDIRGYRVTAAVCPGRSPCGIDTNQHHSLDTCNGRPVLLSSAFSHVFLSLGDVCL